MAASTASRARAAVLGGLVADAATQPLHWLYDLPRACALAASGPGGMSSPEFFHQPSNPWYSAAVGSTSCYGDELIPLLKSMAENEDGCNFNADRFSEVGSRWGVGGESAMTHRPQQVSTLDSVDVLQAIREFYSHSPSYRNKSIRTVMAAMEEGKRGVQCGDVNDTQANCYAKVVSKKL